MKISILGCGWLGLELAKMLQENGHDITCSYQHEDTQRKLKKYHLSDVYIHINHNGIAGDIDFFNCDCLIVTLPFKRSFADPSTYLYWFKHILNAAHTSSKAKESSKNSAPWIIMTSSTSVYPNSAGEVTEKTPITPETPRQLALLETENYIKTHAESWTILRLAGLVGPQRRPGKFLSGKRDIIDGPINLVDRNTVIKRIQTIINHKLENTLINLVDDFHPLKSDFYSQKAKEMMMPPPTFSAASPSTKIIRSLINWTAYASD